MIQDFAKPGRCSFIYVGAGLKEPINPEAVVAFDNPEHEDMYDHYILWGDGHVDFASLSMLIQVLEDLEAGKNPPSSSTNLTMEQAKGIFERKWRGRMPAMQIKGWRTPTTQSVE